jgi:excisionase family DNA binding protein
MNEMLLTIEQAAERLQLNPATVRRQCVRGALRGIKRGRQWRVPESALSEPAPAQPKPAPDTTTGQSR